MFCGRWTFVTLYINGPCRSSNFKDDKPEQIKHELIQYSVRTINNSQVSRKTYPRKMHALYEKTSLYESDSAIFGAD